MASFSFNEIEGVSYAGLRYSFLLAAEGWKGGLAYLDSHTPALPTIGIGFNLEDSETVREKVLLNIFYPDTTETEFLAADDTYKTQIEYIISHSSSYSTSKALSDALSAVMSARADDDAVTDTDADCIFSVFAGCVGSWAETLGLGIVR